MRHTPEGNDSALELHDVRTYHPMRQGSLARASGSVKAVDGVSVTVRPGETLGLVGESGCGKSTLARTIVGLDSITSGSIVYQGVDVANQGGARTRRLRREIQMVFQDPFASLDPKMRVLDIVTEGPRAQRRMDRKQARVRGGELMEMVGLRPDHLERFPSELSGGQRQRVGIARALAVDPSVLIADEAVAALDVSVQAQVLNLFVSLQDRLDLTYVFIAHDLSVIEYISDRIGVMYLGRLVELGPSRDVMSKPLMPYTYALLSAVPAERRGRERVVLQGEPPSPLNPPTGCPFRDRCWRASDLCRTERPELVELDTEHSVACHHPLTDGVEAPDSHR